MTTSAPVRFARAFALAWSRAMIVNLAPSIASSSAAARPMPFVAPVMTTRLLATPMSSPLLREDPDLHVVRLLLDVDRQIPELVDDLVDVLGLDLAHVEVHTLFVKGAVHLLLSR